MQLSSTDKQKKEGIIAKLKSFANVLFEGISNKISKKLEIGWK